MHFPVSHAQAIQEFLMAERENGLNRRSCLRLGKKVVRPVVMSLSRKNCSVKIAKNLCRPYK